MRSHRRRAPLVHALIAGNIDDLDSVRAVLALLPHHAYGQVFIQTDVDTQLPVLHTPPRVTVHCVLPGVDHDLVADPGAPLTDAIAGWVAEWLPEQPDTTREISIWIGARSKARVDIERPGLADLVERI